MQKLKYTDSQNSGSGNIEEPTSLSSSLIARTKERKDLLHTKLLLNTHNYIVCKLWTCN